MKTESVTKAILDSLHGDEIIESIVEAAYSRYVAAGRESDFCLQVVTATRIVFGSTNRVIWSAADGLKPDMSYCTKEFLARWPAP